MEGEPNPGTLAAMASPGSIARDQHVVILARNKMMMPFSVLRPRWEETVFLAPRTGAQATGATVSLK